MAKKKTGSEEEEYKKDLKAAGVDLEDDEEEEEDEEDEEEDDDSEDDSEDDEDEDDDEEEEDDEDSEDDDEDSDEDEDEEEDDEEDEDEEEDPKSKKSKKSPSIYKAYKDKKKEVKDLKAKLKALEEADGEDEEEEALDELEEFAKSIKASPEVLKKMRELFVKDLKPDKSLDSKLKEFEKFREEHKKDMALVNFNKEFGEAKSFLKEIFPKASKTEIKAIKVRLEKLVHSEGEWNDKPLDFVIFKNKDKLSKLISPKKKGLESRTRHETEELDDEFDPNADLTEMSGTQRAAWEKKYNKIMKKSTGLSKDGSGKKIII